MYKWDVRKPSNKSLASAALVSLWCGFIFLEQHMTYIQLAGKTLPESTS